MSNSHILGFWHKAGGFCDYCKRKCDKLYIVKAGPCTGNFCSRLHWQEAYDEMTGKKEVKHENI